MKRLIFLLFPAILFGCIKPDSKYSEYPIKKPEIKNVVITDNFWLPKIKTIQETTIQTSFDKCHAEGRMENFLIAGGVNEGKVRGKMPFDDTDLYKIIEGASYTLISSPDATLDAYIDSIISIIKTGQEADGYLTTWFTIDPASPPAPWVQVTKKRWLSVGGHELYNSGHLFEAAAAHYYATGKKNLLDIALKNADLLVNTFGPDKLQLPPDHQIVETGLVKLYQITHEEKYLELARFFLDQRGNSTTHELQGTYSQDHLPVTQQFEAVGHAVRAVYMYAGMTDIAAIYGDSAYLNAVNKLWDNVVTKKMYITGGIGSKHDGEAFGENYELPDLTAYNETCASIGNVYWNHRLFLLTGSAKYYDIIERTLYNGLISGISLSGTEFFYPNPLEADCKYNFNQGAQTRKSWFDCSCCPTNLIRFIPSIPELIYATHNKELYVNLFIANTAQIAIDGMHTEIIQQTEYPWNGSVKMLINPEKASEFAVKIRIPGWTQNQAVPGNLYEYTNGKANEIVIKVNGEITSYTQSNGYADISRLWKAGDAVEFDLPMEIHKVITNEKVTENRQKVAIEYGPIVYCAEEMDNEITISELGIPDSITFNVEKRDDLLGGINVIRGEMLDSENKSSNLTLIPYYAWSNRGVGQMKVWLPIQNRLEKK
jgi:DUF1680 family protein